MYLKVYVMHHNALQRKVVDVKIDNKTIQIPMTTDDFITKELTSLDSSKSTG